MDKAAPEPRSGGVLDSRVMSEHEHPDNARVSEHFKTALSQYAPPDGWKDEELRYVRYVVDEDLRVRVDGEAGRRLLEYMAGRYAIPTRRSRSGWAEASWSLRLRPHVDAAVRAVRAAQMHATVMDRTARARMLENMARKAAELADETARAGEDFDFDSIAPEAHAKLATDLMNTRAKAAAMYGEVRKMLETLAREVGDRDPLRLDARVEHAPSEDAYDGLLRLFGIAEGTDPPPDSPAD